MRSSAEREASPACAATLGSLAANPANEGPTDHLPLPACPAHDHAVRVAVRDTAGRHNHLPTSSSRTVAGLVLWTRVTVAAVNVAEVPRLPHTDQAAATNTRHATTSDLLRDLSSQPLMPAAIPRGCGNRPHRRLPTLTTNRRAKPMLPGLLPEMPATRRASTLSHQSTPRNRGE